MNWGFFWTIVAVVVPAAGIAISWRVYKRQFPKRQVGYSVSYSPLVSVQSDGLEVMLAGHPVANPYVVEFELISQSRADIPSGMFDAGRSLVFSFGDRAILGSTPTANSAIEHDAEGAELRFPPQLIRKRAHLSATFIVDGMPSETRIQNPMIDIEVAPLRPVFRSRLPSKDLVLMIWLLFGLVFALVVLRIFVLH
jgi:hypothetical protein